MSLSPFTRVVCVRLGPTCVVHRLRLVSCVRFALRHRRTILYYVASLRIRYVSRALCCAQRIAVGFELLGAFQLLMPLTCVLSRLSGIVNT